jgi:hypothetical protein
MNEQEQNSQKEFNLDSYRNLLERLQKSRADKERLDKKAPTQVMQQLQ